MDEREREEDKAFLRIVFYQ